MLKFLSNINKLKPNKQQLKLLASAVLGTAIIAAIGSIHLFIGILLFAIFSLYLRMEALTRQINRSPETSRPQENSNLRSSPAKVTNSSDQQTENTDKEIQTNPQDTSDLLSKVQHLEEQLSQKDEAIKALQDSIEVMSQRLDQSETRSILLDHFEEVFLTRPEFQRRLEDYDEKIESLAALKLKVHDTQIVCSKLIEAMKSEVEVERRREEMEQHLVPLVKQIEDKLSLYFKETPNVTQVENRVSKIENRMGMVSDIIKVLEKADLRFIDLENNSKSLANAILRLNDILNNRIDCLSYAIRSNARHLSKELSEQEEEVTTRKPPKIISIDLFPNG